MTTHTQQISANLKVHNELLRSGYCPVPAENTDKPQGKAQQKWVRVSADFHEKWYAGGYEKNNDRLEGGEAYNMEYARRIGALKLTNKEDAQTLTKIYAGDKGVNILLDGKLALLDFDDKDNPKLYESFEEEFPFLKQCYKDRNPAKPWSYHYLIPDDEAFIGITGTGQITGKYGDFHLIHPKVNDASVQVDFKKIAKDGRWSEDDNDEKQATNYGGKRTPTISTYSQRETLQKLPKWFKMKKLKKDPSYKLFIKYMKTVYRRRSETGGNKKQVIESEVPTAITKQEQIKIKKNTKIHSVEDFKKLPVWKFIQEEWDEEEGYKHTISKQPDGKFMIDLGKAECARTCPFTGCIHKSNNFWLLYLPLKQKLVQYCFGCSGQNSEIDWKETSDYEKAFWEGAGGQHVRSDWDSAEEDFQNGLNAIGELLNDHLCYIDKKGQSEYVLYNYGYMYSVKTAKGLKDYYLCWRFKPKMNYWVETGKAGEKTSKRYNHGGEAWINPVDCWLHYPKQHRRCYMGFKPAENFDDRGRMFNTFQGFAITKSVAEAYMKHKGIKHEDVEELMKPVLDHIMKIWCNNKQNRFDYVISWFAQVLQKPCEKTKVALCLKSDFEGAGKSVIVGMMKNIIGEYHSVSLNEFPEGFNDIMADKCFINLDEALWGKDKSAAKVKVFITEEHQQIKKKFKDEYTQDAYHNVLISTNEDFMCPKDIGSRRYYILDLSNKYAGITNDEKRKHFKPIWEIAKQPELFAYYLYTYPLGDFDPKQFDETEIGLAVAQIGMSNVKAWLYYCLQNDEFYSVKETSWSPETGNQESETIYRCGDVFPKKYLEESYCDYTKTEYGGSKRFTQFWRELYKLVPKHKVEAGQRSAFNRRYCVKFPPLAETRKFFTNGWSDNPGTTLPFEEVDTTMEYDITPNEDTIINVDLDTVEPSKKKKMMPTPKGFKPCMEWRQVHRQYEYVNEDDEDEELLEMDADMIEYVLEGEKNYRYECKVRKGDDEVFKTRDFHKFCVWLTKEAGITFEDVINEYEPNNPSGFQFSDPNKQPTAIVSFD